MSYTQYAPLITTAAAWAGIPAAVLTGVLGAESSFEADPGLSSAGAIGIAQMMPDTARALGIDPTDPEQAVYGAAYLLRQGHDQFGSWPLAVAAYNAGAGAVERYGGIPPYEETQTYVDRVLGGVNYDQQPQQRQPAPVQTRTSGLGSAQSAAIADSVRNGLLGGVTMPSTTTNAGSAATGVDIAGGTGIAQILAQIAQMMAQIRGSNSATAGIMDPRLLTGSQSTDVSGYLPTLAAKQFEQTKRDADRQYALDESKYGLSIAQFNYQQRIQSAQLGLDTLSKMAQMSGPKDQIAYQYALKGLQAPAPTQQVQANGPGGLLEGLNQPYGQGGGAAPRGAAAPGTLAPEDALAKAHNLSALWNAGRFDDFHAQGGTAATPAPADQWGAGNPSADQHPDVPGIQGAGWTPDTYSDSPYTAGADQQVQHADLPGGGQVSWDPNAPGNGIPGYSQGGLLEGVASKAAPGRERHIEDALYGDETPEQPEPPMTPAEILEMLRHDPQRMAGGGTVGGGTPQKTGGGLLDDVDQQGALIAAVIRHLGDGQADEVDATTNQDDGGTPSAAVVGDIPGQITGGEEIAAALPPKDGRSRFAVAPLSASKDPAEVAARMPMPLARAAIGGIFGDTNINSNGTGGPGTAPSGAVYSPEAIGSQPAVQAIKNPTVKQPRFTGFQGGISNPDYGLLDLPSAPSAQVLETLLPSQWDSLQSAYEQGAGVDFRDILAQSQAASPVGHGRYGSAHYGN